MTTMDSYERGLDMSEEVRGARLDIPMRPGEPASGIDVRRATIGNTFGDSWTRTAIDQRTRAMLTVAISATLGTLGPLRGHLEMALHLGVTKDELVDVFIHLAAYAGAPLAFSAYQVALDVFEAQASA